MALIHAQPLEVIDIRPLGAALRASVTTSIIKTERLQLMRLVLPAGASLPEHKVAGEVTIQCIEGVVAIGTPLRECRLRAGELVLLPGGEPHSVRAQQDASLLVSVLRLP